MTVSTDNTSTNTMTLMQEVEVEVEYSFEDEDIRVGVKFSSPRVYTYLAPLIVHVNSIVVVPGSWFDPDPQTAEVVTLDPPPYNGPIKRVLAVLS